MKYFVESETVIFLYMKCSQTWRVSDYYIFIKNERKKQLLLPVTYLGEPSQTLLAMWNLYWTLHLICGGLHQCVSSMSLCQQAVNAAMLWILIFVKSYDYDGIKMAQSFLYFFPFLQTAQSWLFSACIDNRNCTEVFIFIIYPVL